MPERRPIEIEETLFDSAERAGSAFGRSASNQIARWARAGRALEASGEVSLDQVEAALSGELSYDALNPSEQRLVWTEWPERIEQRIKGLDLVGEFREKGASYFELDDKGNVVERRP
jgi:hypothetical protein